ncbi:MAG: hypothetical protein PPHEINF_2379 [uncultured Paraburkholderia sp.]|nr:MAG: hypothetical protein PPHEINF_2379 [uncultured Paraburkholderia sp.]CAH2787930.1 MAG: hypothetical protein PPHEESC_2472 [uncultured Paraburkholderia sp.]CAH2921490.1 MAG: hypothetical protein PPHERAN_2297 [uncultured Paraburkholderia sp.]
MKTLYGIAWHAKQRCAVFQIPTANFGTVFMRVSASQGDASIAVVEVDADRLLEQWRRTGGKPEQCADASQALWPSDEKFAAAEIGFMGRTIRPGSPCPHDMPRGERRLGAIEHCRRRDAHHLAPDRGRHDFPGVVSHRRRTRIASMRRGCRQPRPDNRGSALTRVRRAVPERAASCRADAGSAHFAGLCAIEIGGEGAAPVRMSKHYSGEEPPACQDR